MTFIASVIARDGAAIIADSLVTSMHRTIEEKDFLELIQTKAKARSKKVNISQEDIEKLFKLKPSHTKDYENKLFKYDNYTAITTSGAAQLNGKKIQEILEEKIKANSKDPNYSKKNIDEKVEDFCKYLELKLQEHLKTSSSFSGVRFIITYFDTDKSETKIFKVTLYPASRISIKTSKRLSESNEAAPYEKVVCDGQNRTSERVLYGDILTRIELIPKIALQVAKDFKIDTKNITDSYINDLRSDKTLMPEVSWKEAKLFRLTELSLQQAVDLASLLMNLEIDFQKYTESIPTVGGVVKLAVINKDGFKFVAGDDVNIKRSNF